MTPAVPWILSLWVANPHTGLSDWVPFGNPVESRAKCMEVGQTVLTLMKQRQGFVATRWKCEQKPSGEGDPR